MSPWKPFATDENSTLRFNYHGQYAFIVLKVHTRHRLINLIICHLYTGWLKFGGFVDDFVAIILEYLLP